MTRTVPETLLIAYFVALTWNKNLKNAYLLISPFIEHIYELIKKFFLPCLPPFNIHDTYGP